MKIPYKLAVILHKLIAAGCGPVRREGDEFRCRCPAHDDRGPSFYIVVKEDRVLAHCKAGCTVAAVCDALDVTAADLFLEADDPWVEVDAEFTILDSGPTTDAPGAGVMPQSGGKTDTGERPADALRNAVYAELLAALELNADHFDDLLRRGLSAAEIDRRGYKTAEPTKVRGAVDALLRAHGRDRLLTVPGFADKDGRLVFRAGRGYLIPVRTAGGAIAALKVRHDTDVNGPKYSWASGKGVSCGNVVHVPLDAAAPADTVRLTEGELKADVATVRSGLPTVSAPGVSNWHLAVPVLRALGAHKVLLAFDQDGKPGTLAAVEKALFGLTREGFEVVVEWWDGRQAKGIDDLLAAGGQPELVAGLAAAVRVSDRLAAPDDDQGAVAEEGQPAAFPVDVFPPALAEFCRQVAAATGTPPDFAGQAMLVTAGAALGNSRALCLKEHTWYEAARFYAVNVGDPSSGKTPALEAVVRPYQRRQLRLLEQYRADHAEYERKVAEYEKAAAANRARAADERPPLPLLPEEPDPPERWVVDDATVEALAPRLERNPRGLLNPQDEGAAWVRAMGQYKGGRGNDRQFWLKCWSGQSHIVDRKTVPKENGAAVPVAIARPFINVICGLPPDLLGELGDHRGRNDGFLHRLLFGYPEAAAGTEWTEAAVTPEAERSWEDTLTRLRALEMAELEGGRLGHRAVRLSPEAKERWVAWWDRHAAEMRGAELPAALIGTWGKLRSYAARLTLVVHYLWHAQGAGPEGDVTAASVERAARLVEYYKSHLRRVYGRLRQTPEDNHLLEVLDWIRRKGGRCRPRDLVHAKKVTPTEKAKKVLKELEERGYGRVEWQGAANGKKVMWFALDLS